MKQFKRGVIRTTRRNATLLRLEAQLSRGNKNTKQGTEPLTEKDITRISKEIEVLTHRIKNS